MGADRLFGVFGVARLDRQCHVVIPFCRVRNVVLYSTQNHVTPSTPCPLNLKGTDLIGCRRRQQLTLWAEIRCTCNLPTPRSTPTMSVSSVPTVQSLNLSRDMAEGSYHRFTAAADATTLFHIP